MPPGMPADIPIVEGDLVAGKRTLFEDGKGYVLSIESKRAYPEVVQFYKDHYANGRIAPAPGMGPAFSVARFSVGDKRVFLEIHAKEKLTQITMAIHLGRWW
jgi:hypothetical protein